MNSLTPFNISGMVKVSKRYTGKPGVVSVHRLVLFLSSSTDQQVVRVKACPNCYMPEFRTISSNYGGQIICKTCYEVLKDHTELKSFRRKEYLHMLKQFPLLNNGMLFPVKEEKEVCYNDLNEVTKEILDRHL
jgi:hypothetical protein